MTSDTFDHSPNNFDKFGKNDVFGAPVLCGETVYTDALCRIRKIWTWSVDSLYQDRERGSLKARLGGNRFGLGGLYTFVSIAGNRLTDQVFDYIGSFSEGLALVMTQESGCGYIDKNMDLVIPLQFDSAEDFDQGYACASIGKEQFYIDKRGQKLPNASPQAWQSYQKLGGFYEGMGLVSTLKLGLGSLAHHSDYADISGTWGFIDGTGREVIPPQYIYALDFCDGIAIVAKGKWTIDPKWDNEHNKGRYWTEEEWWGGIDKAGNEVIPFIFDESKRFDDCSDAYIAHTGGWKDGHWGVIDRSGNWLASPVFTMIDYSFHEGLFAFFY